MPRSGDEAERTRMTSEHCKRLVLCVGLGLLLASSVQLVSLWASPQQVTTSEQKAAFLARLSTVAIERASHVVRYDPAYVKIPYPAGDVPADTGVCSDEVIRSYRALGIDLQKQVHEDILRAPSAYGVHRADSNIDHRRVERLMVFFRRHGESLPTTKNAVDYQPGDIVAWDLHNGKGKVLYHIGIVVNRQRLRSTRYMVLHNIGSGPQIEDVLLDWKIIGHYRYYGAN
jgi:uncharacterized protein